MSDIPNAHDRFFKQVFSRPAVAEGLPELLGSLRDMSASTAFGFLKPIL